MRWFPTTSLVLLAACGITPVQGIDHSAPSGDDVDAVQVPADEVTDELTTAADAITAAAAPTETDTVFQDAPSVVPGEWVVRMKAGAQVDDIRGALDDLGAADIASVVTRDTYRFHSEAAAETVGQLVDQDAVAWVEPVITMMPLSVTVNDPNLADQWHIPHLRVDEAWAWNMGAGATVAVVDTGVTDMDELDVDGDRWDGIENLLPQHSYVDLAPVPLNSQYQVELIGDDVGHGTHIASTIAQRTDNGLSGAGIAPDAAILPIRALGQYGGTSTDVADAIRYAADNGADVINLSLGSPLYSEIIADACQYAFDAGVVLIAATGNDGGSYVHYPAALDTTLAVGAAGPDQQVADYSSRGEAVDVVAPGGVFYDYDRNGYFDGILAETWQVWSGVDGYEDGVYIGPYFFHGTSMATATVSGVAALLVAEGATNQEVMDLLTTTAVDMGSPGWDMESGFGIVDAAAALEAFAGPAPEPEPEAPRTAEELTAADLLITEFMADPTWCSGDSCEWFEVENTSGTEIDLAGLVVRDAGGAEGTIDASVVLAPGQLAVIGRGSAAGWDQPDVTPAAFYGTRVTLNNGGDSLVLANGAGDLASATWSDSAAGMSWMLDGSDWVTATDTHALPTSGEWATPGVR